MVIRQGRRVVVLIALLLGATGSDRARADDVGGGFKVGVNRATLSGEQADAAHAESITGLVTGVFLRVGVGARFAVQPELLFSRNGARGDTLGFVGTVRLDYVELPVLLRYSFRTGDGLIPRLFLGPAFRYRLSADVVSDTGVSRGLDTVVRRSDYGLVVGGDVGIPTGGPELSIEVRYMLGMTNIDDTGSGADFENRVFSIVAGLCFDTGGGEGE